MRRLSVFLAIPLLLCGCALSAGRPSATSVDVAAQARRGALRLANRTVTPLSEAGRAGAHITAAAGEGAAWIEGVEMATGTIEVEVRGKDVLQQSFLGIAFAGSNDSTFEAVYLRPFNFRSTDPVRKIHAVQYVSHPVYTWQKLRAERAEVFENPVEPAPDPNGWVPLRIVVEPATVRIYVSEGSEPDLVVERLGERGGRRIGLWVGNLSDGDFANLRVTPAR
jgi:hypothetical protein